jgi:hypothetical protein
MLTDQRKDLGKGMALLLSFAVVFVSLFMPVIKGETPIHLLDRLYNSISKGSVNYIPSLLKESRQHLGTDIQFSIEMESPAQAEQIATMFTINGITAETDSSRITISGDLGAITGHILSDADHMFHNNGSGVRQRYSREEKRVLYDWWQVLKAMSKELKVQKRFDDASFVMSVQTKAVECSFNYYGIESQDIIDQALLVVLSLVFYVFYTIWFGYAILFFMTGMGLKLEH